MSDSEVPERSPSTAALPLFLVAIAAINAIPEFIGNMRSILPPVGLLAIAGILGVYWLISEVYSRKDTKSKFFSVAFPPLRPAVRVGLVAAMGLSGVAYLLPRPDSRMVSEESHQTAQQVEQKIEDVRVRYTRLFGAYQVPLALTIRFNQMDEERFSVNREDGKVTHAIIYKNSIQLDEALRQFEELEIGKSDFIVTPVWSALQREFRPFYAPAEDNPDEFPVERFDDPYSQRLLKSDREFRKNIVSYREAWSNEATNAYGIDEAEVSLQVAESSSEKAEILAELNALKEAQPGLERASQSAEALAFKPIQKIGFLFIELDASAVPEVVSEIEVEFVEARTDPDSDDPRWPYGSILPDGERITKSYILPRANRKTITFLLACYRAGPEGFPESYLYAPLRPVSVTWSSGSNTTRQTLRMPLFNEAAKVLVPFGWTGQ